MEISFGINEIMRKATGVHDPYKSIKAESNANALHLIPRAEALLDQSNDPLFDAIKIAIAGNIIDYGIKIDYDLSATLNNVMKKTPFLNDYLLLKEQLSKAKIVTYLADNAGEIVFDKLLLKQINKQFNIDRIILVVKQYPFVNDVVVEDLNELGFEELANLEVVSVENLTDKNYSKQLKPYTEIADVVIAKGQGNFELLYDKNLGLFFLFIVKCEVVKEILHSEEEDVIISYH